MGKSKIVDLLRLSEFKKNIINLIPTKTSQLQNDSGYKTTDTTYEVVSKTAPGLAPQLPNETAITRYLRQDGSWQVPPNTTYGIATQSANGLMSAVDKKKLDEIAEDANKTTLTTSLAVTQSGVSALDGSVGKILNDKGAQIAFYQDTDSKWHFRDWSGADTVIPFNPNSGGNFTAKIGVVSGAKDGAGQWAYGIKTIISLTYKDGNLSLATSFTTANCPNGAYKSGFASTGYATANKATLDSFTKN